MTSSVTMAVHESLMASSPELPINNKGESVDVKVGAMKNLSNSIY